MFVSSNYLFCFSVQNITIPIFINVVFFSIKHNNSNIHQRICFVFSAHGSNRNDNPVHCLRSAERRPLVTAEAGDEGSGRRRGRRRGWTTAQRSQPGNNPARLCKYVEIQNKIKIILRLIEGRKSGTVRMTKIVIGEGG